jgi:hypothetical protein
MTLPQGKRGKMTMDNSNKANYNGPERRSQVADEQEIITTRELVELSYMVKQLMGKMDDLSNEFKHYKKEHDDEDSAHLSNMERLYRKTDTDINVLKNKTDADLQAIREDVKELKTWKKGIEEGKTNGLGAKVRNQALTVLVTSGTLAALAFVYWLISSYIATLPKP